MRGRTIIVLLLALLLLTMTGGDHIDDDDDDDDDGIDDDDESEKHQPEKGYGQYPPAEQPPTSNESIPYVEFYIYAALGPE
jgi:hypothetical protein